MGEVDASFNWSPIEPRDYKALADGAYILMINVDKSPPHLMLCNKGFLFDWTVSGIRTKIPAGQIIPSIIKKGKKIIAIKVKKMSLEVCEETFQIQNHKQYKTCLGAIKNVMNKSCHLNFEGELIFEFYEELLKENLILALYEWNIGKAHYKVKKYSLEDVHHNVNQLRL